MGKPVGFVAVSFESHKPFPDHKKDDALMTDFVVPPAIQFIRLQFVDILGFPKSVEIPAQSLPAALQHGISFDGSSVEGFAAVDDSDLKIMPDLATFRPWPHAKGVAVVHCDVTTRQGLPYSSCSHEVLRRQISKLPGGVTMKVGAEPEFFMLKEENGQLLGNIEGGGYYDMPAGSQGGTIRREIVYALQQLGFEVEVSHHEHGKGQHEIGFKHMNALDMADHVVRFKQAAKDVAASYGHRATFMPKPFEGIPGSGMHCNVSLWSAGQNLFYDNGGLSQDALHFIGGLIRHAPALSAITNPLVNSYKRLVPGFEAPVNICWGYSNRTAWIRVPAFRNPAKEARVEVRSPDPAANPYLAFAAILAAGWDGVANEIAPPHPVQQSVYRMGALELGAKGIHTLPSSLKEALRALEADEVVCGALGQEFVHKYIALKEGEWHDYQVQVGDWERDKYLKY